MLSLDPSCPEANKEFYDLLKVMADMNKK
jgi:hypothetical protein